MSDDTNQDTKIPIKLIPLDLRGENESIQKSIIPLTGKLITSQDGITIGNNFKTLKNMRYRDDYLMSISGMSKINSTPTSSLKIRSSFHLNKEQPVESHVLIQVTD
jgi:hypothetical protein